MDYTMESLTVGDVRVTVGDVRVCDDKFPVQSSFYDGTSLDNRERLIQGDQTYKSNHEVNLMDASPPPHITINNHIPRIIGGKDSDIPRQYGIECNMIAENVYPARGEMGAPFDRPCLYNGNSKARGSEQNVYKEGASNEESYIYCNETGFVQESMSVKHEDSLGRYPWYSLKHENSLGRYPLNSVDVARSVDNMADFRQEKVAPARCGSYEPVVSDFLPETPQNKEHYYVIISSDRGSHCNEAVQDSTVQCQESAQEGRSGYTQMMSQHAHFSDVDFQRAEHFGESQQGGNMLCLENSSTQGELYCPSTDVVDILKRPNGEAGFESGSKVSNETREPAMLVGGDFSKQMEDTSAVEALMTLQGESRAIHGTESNRVAVLISNAVYETCTKLQDVSESHKGDNNGEPGFESGSKVSNGTRGLTMLVGGDFSEQMEDTRAVEALMSLQGESRATQGTEALMTLQGESRATQGTEALMTLQGESRATQGTEALMTLQGESRATQGTEALMTLQGESRATQGTALMTLQGVSRATQGTEALMTLQGESRATHESNRVPVLTSNEVYESTAKLQDVSESYKGDNSDQHYLSNSDSVPGPDLQAVNAKRRIKVQGRKYPQKSKKSDGSADVDNNANRLAKLLRKSERKLNQDDIVQLRSVDKAHKKGKHKIKTRGFNGESKVVGQDMVSNCKEEKDKKKTDEPQAGSSITDRNSLLPEDDAVSVQSVDSPPSPPVGKKRKFKCKLCKRSWKFRKDLNKHMKTHAATKKFTCSVCSTGFINRTLLRKHLLTHSDIKLFTCPECAFTCHSLGELKSHQQIHARAEVFSCSECSFTAKRQKQLAMHMLVHSAVKVYHCQFCKFSSKRKYSLQRHVKTAHSSAQTHECSVCDFNTNAVDSFKVHVAMHASTRTMSCIICGAVIKKRPNLIEHLLSHSNDEDTTCKECGETCTMSHEYILHLLNHKDLSSTSLEGVSQDSVFDLNSPPLNEGGHSTSGTFGFLARKNKAIMDTPTMEAKLAQMSTVASRLADMTKVITLLNEKSKVVFQLAEVSTLATELAVISGNVLQSYKNAYGVTADATTTKAKTPPSSNDATDDSSIEDDDYEMLPELSISAAKMKEELQENAYLSTDADMQIQVDLNGTAISCVQNDDLFKVEGEPTSKGTKVLKCSRCSMTFTDSRSLKRHLLAHDNVRPYYCESCGSSFRRNEHLKKHMVTHSDERPFTCKDCPYAAKTEHRLKIHALCHSQTKAYACQRCTYTARTNYELNHHMKRHEPRSCSQCSFVSYSRAELKKHVFTHSSFDCNECDFTTNDRAEYTKHMKKHSLVQHLCCELCGYSCDTMKKFKYHKLRHDNKTPYQCQDCDYRCSSRASFDCHRLKHAGLKPYLCSFCGAAFRKTSHLNQHLLIHKDEKSFKCSKCNYSCRTKHNLKEHEMTHSGEKPFSCKYCSFSCRRNKALQLHMLKHESSGMMISSLQMPSMGHSNLQNTTSDVYETFKTQNRSDDAHIFVTQNRSYDAHFFVTQNKSDDGIDYLHNTDIKFGIKKFEIKKLEED